MTHHVQSGNEGDKPCAGMGLIWNSSLAAAATPRSAVPELPTAEPVTTMSLM